MTKPTITAICEPYEGPEGDKRMGCQVFVDGRLMAFSDSTLTDPAEAREAAIVGMRKTLAERVRQPLAPDRALWKAERRARIAAEVTLADVARYLNATPGTVSRWEHGLTEAPAGKLEAYREAVHRLSFRSQQDAANDDGPFAVYDCYCLACSRRWVGVAPVASETHDLWFCPSCDTRTATWSAYPDDDEEDGRESAV